MPTKMTIFCTGALGTASVYAAFYARHPQPIGDHFAAYGLLGIALALAAGILAVAIGGLWTLAWRPWGIVPAFLLGLIPPGLVLAAGVPQFGRTDRLPPEPGVQTTASARRPGSLALESVWLVAAPVQTFARTSFSTTERQWAARAGEEIAQARGKAEREAAKAVAEARRQAEADRAKGVADAKAAAEQVRAEAVAEGRAEAAREAEKSLVETRDSADREKAEALLHQKAEFEGEKARLEAEVRSLREAAERTGPLVLSADSLRLQLAEATHKSALLETELADWRMLARWFDASDYAVSGSPCVKVL
ncbi:MAG: hypothetical protein L0216_06565, partial [Planctomycetales bacterium]|nr:hypothetical protein [Planctomycetales bacterium]